MSWATIRDGMKTRLDTISGLSARDTAPDSLPERDTATVLPGEPLISPSGHRGKVEVNIIVRVRCSRGKVRDSQDALDPYLWPTGTKSIIAAVDGGPTLNAAVDACQFVTVQNYGGIEGSAAVQADVVFRGIVTA